MENKHGERTDLLDDSVEGSTPHNASSDGTNSCIIVNETNTGHPQINAHSQNNGAIPKEYKQGNGVSTIMQPNNTASASVSEESMISSNIAPNSKDKLKHWKAAGVALRQALSQVGKNVWPGQTKGELPEIQSAQKTKITKAKLSVKSNVAHKKSQIDAQNCHLSKELPSQHTKKYQRASNSSLTAANKSSTVHSDSCCMDPMNAMLEHHLESHGTETTAAGVCDSGSHIVEAGTCDTATALHGAFVAIPTSNNAAAARSPLYKRTGISSSNFMSKECQGRIEEEYHNTKDSPQALSNIVSPLKCVLQISPQLRHRSPNKSLDNSNNSECSSEIKDQKCVSLSEIKKRIETLNSRSPYNSQVPVRKKSFKAARQSLLNLSSSSEELDCDNKQTKHKRLKTKSKLPIPIKRTSPLLAKETAGSKSPSEKLVSKRIPPLKTATEGSSQTELTKLPESIMKKCSLVEDYSNTPDLLSSSDSSLSDGEVLSFNDVPNKSKTKEGEGSLTTTESMANFADGELSSGVDVGSLGSEGEDELIEQAVGMLAHLRDNNSEASVSSPPSLLSSSDEDEDILAAKMMLQRLQRRQKGGDSAEQSREKEADAESLDLASDSSSLFADMPDLMSEESPAHEEDAEPIRLSQQDLDSLPQLILSSGDEADDVQDKKKDESKTDDKEDAENNEEADDEFECECPMCQYTRTRLLGSMMSESMWVTDNEEEDRDYYHEVDDGYDQPFRFSPEELSPLGMILLQQGRTSILELMFHNVITQMLVVYPDLLGEQAPPPLPQEILDSLPVITLTNTHLEKCATCPICLCDFAACEEAKQLPCQHLFHSLCIHAWLTKSGTCPVCRHNLQAEPTDTT